MPDKVFRVDMSYCDAMDNVNRFLKENPEYTVTHSNIFANNGHFLAIIVCSPANKQSN